MDTRLVFENHSYDVNRSEILVYQQDRLAAHEAPIAWRIIRHCGYESLHPFCLPSELVLVVFNPWGNCVGQRPITPPSALTIHPQGNGGREIRQRPDPGGLVTVTNQLETGALHVYLARDGRAVTSWRTLAPGTSTAFDLGRQLYFVPWNGLEVGHEIPPAAQQVGKIPGHCFDLQGISRARILMLGGGWGASAEALRFHLHEVLRGPRPF